jgi:hypothetical protein
MVDIDRIHNELGYYKDKYTKAKFKMFIGSVLMMLEYKEAIQKNINQASICQYYDRYMTIDKDMFSRAKGPYHYFLSCYIHCFNTVGRTLHTLEHGCSLRLATWEELLGVDAECIGEVMKEMINDGVLFMLPEDEGEKKISRFWTDTVITPEIKDKCIEVMVKRGILKRAS